MKRDRNMLTRFGLMAACVLVLSVVGLALAGNVYDRDTKALSTSLGTATWTNTFQYSALELKRVSIDYSLAAANTVTVTRVTSDGVYTQAVGSITVAAGIGSTASFTASYFKYGDLLKFSSGIATGSTAIIEFEVQKH